MTIKTKLALSIGALVLIILVLSHISSKYLNALKDDTENILKANYNSVEYSQKMLAALESKTLQASADSFAKYLNKQQKNITEGGEAELTAKLGADFYLLKNTSNVDSLKTVLRTDLYALIQMNMKAIIKKSRVAEATAGKGIGWLTVTGLISITLAVIIWIVFPAYLSKPIRQLNEGIRQIAEKKYSLRIPVERNDEFGEVAATFNLMAARLEEYENSNLSKILFEKKRVETIINGIQDPLLVLDEDKQVIFINTAALSILNITEKDIKGRFAPEVSVGNDLLRSLIRDIMFPLPTADAPSAKPLEIISGGKENYYEKEIIDISYTPIGENATKLLGHVILLKNITALKERDFAKTNFIATISHELKTPISAIKLSLQLLENEKTGSLNTEQTQLLQSISDDAGRLLKITGELLNMSQVETGNIQLTLQPSAPRKIIEQAADATKFLAEQKNINYVYAIEDNLPRVTADTEKTVWVLTNFLTNAIRYSPEQSTITIAAKQTESGVMFSVTDEGKGIDTKYQPKIFDRFFQVPGSPRTGTGLGLSISKEFIEAQGGKIGVNSEIGKGSTFYFEM